jgi:hypothetical protein
MTRKKFESQPLTSKPESRMILHETTQQLTVRLLHHVR